MFSVLSFSWLVFHNFRWFSRYSFWPLLLFSILLLLLKSPISASPLSPIPFIFSDLPLPFPFPQNFRHFPLTIPPFAFSFPHLFLCFPFLTYIPSDPQTVAIIMNKMHKLSTQLFQCSGAGSMAFDLLCKTVPCPFSAASSAHL